MVAKKYQVLGIGNAIVDVLARVDDTFLKNHGGPKGSMTLLNAEQSSQLYAAMPAAIERSGGSVGNTIAGIAELGGRAAFIGKVKKDQLGKIFQHDLTSLGVAYLSTPSQDGEETARCMVLVTPDGERTMHTFLGASSHLTALDINEAHISDAEIVYFEGYLWDLPCAKDAYIKAMKTAKKTGGRVALSLSDAFCVARYRQDFLGLVKNHVDILFANEEEIISLYQTDTLEAACEAASQNVSLAAITRGARGCIIIQGNTSFTIPAHETAVVDTTGAGDLFAAGFLHAITNGKPLEDAAMAGCLLASKVISILGARLTGAV